jgi:hypothetical protein
MVIVEVNVMSTENKPLTFPDVQQTFLNALDNFGKKLKILTDDLRAIEIITAYGETTFAFESKKPEDSEKKKYNDITDLANVGGEPISGKMTILARTRMELDGDLLVILPTTQTLTSSSSSPDSVTTAGGTTSGGTAGGTTSGGTAGGTTTTNIKENEPIAINNEVLNLHKENVNMAIQNLQFVYSKVLDIASKFAESGGPNNFMSFFRKR